MSRLSTSISPAASSSPSAREKYSGVRLRREATVALLTGSETVTTSPLTQSSASCLRSR